MRSGHKCGKTILAACIALWFACCFPRARVILTAPTHRQVTEVLWREVRRLYSESRVSLGGKIAKSAAAGLRWDDGREILGFSTDKPENMAGFSGQHVLFVVDEASGFEEPIFDTIEGNAQSGARIFMISNPTRTVGAFFDAFHRNANLWTRIHISSEEAAKYADRIPGLSRPEEVAQKIALLGRDHPIVRVKVLGEFPSSTSNAIVSLHLVDKGKETWRALLAEGLRVVYGDALPEKITLADIGRAIGVEHGPLEFGVDVARFGDDDTVITARRGKFLFPQIVIHGFDSVAVAGAVLKLARELRTPHERVQVKVDGIGYGSGVVDQLRVQEISIDGHVIKPRELVSVVDVNVAEKADDEEKYPNLRSQLWFGLAEFLAEGGALPPGDGDEDGRLDAELMTPIYKIDAQGRQVVEPKADIKKRMNRSPDRADSVALAVYRRYSPRSGRKDRSGSGSSGGSRFGEGRSVF